METPLVSVIIPAYNHENYVQDTIKSIINQTYENIELIVLDDGSKDFTWQKIEEMREECKQRFVNVIFQTKKNEGTCKTLNTLVDLSKGDFIYIIASDDKAKSTAIEKEITFLKNNNDFALCVGDSEFIDSNGNICYWDAYRNVVYDKSLASYITRKDSLSHKVDFLNDEFGTYETLYRGNYIPNGYLIRKEIFNKIGYFTPDAPLEDYWLMLQISKYSKMKYLDEILFSYRWHNTNTIKDREKMHIYTMRTKLYEQNLLDELYKNKKLPQKITNIYKYGYFTKRRGIPYLFEIITNKKLVTKLKIIKLFNVTILKYEKRLK